MSCSKTNIRKGDKVNNLPQVTFSYNGPLSPKEFKKSVFYVNTGFSCLELDMTDKRYWSYIDKKIERLRNIIERRSDFRYEDIDIIRWNSPIFAKHIGFVSGSTYISDGNLQLFLDGIQEIENIVASYRV